MATQTAPIALTEEVWTELSASCCTVQAMEGHTWIRIADTAPAYAPSKIEGKEYDGHLIGLRGVQHQVLRYSADPAKKVYGRARTADGAIVMVSEV